MHAEDYAEEKRVGLAVQIGFLPNAIAPDSGEIKLLQIVRNAKPKSNEDINYSNTGFGKLDFLKTSDNSEPGVEKGFWVDHKFKETEGRKNVADAPRSPYYRDHWPNPDVSANGCKRGSEIEEASLGDSPSTDSAIHYFFETAAQDVESGHFYGAIHWDFTVDGSPLAASSPTITVHDAPSPTIGAAVKRFNWNYGNPGTVHSPEAEPGAKTQQIGPK